MITTSGTRPGASRSYLVVVAHPDDEVLGAGGLLARCAENDIKATACILSGQVDARAHRPSVDNLRADTLLAAERLGMQAPIIGDFPNVRMNTVPHLELVQFIESAMMEVKATHLVTHHPRDLNDDHAQVARATQAAARLPQRRTDLDPVASLMYMEVPSSTDWSFEGTSRGFEPTVYVPLTNEQVERKISALAAYKDVMRPVPHPRSREVLSALATIRGAACGTRYAEAFQAAYLRLDPHA